MKIVIVGSGYVGLVTGACFASAGNVVHCVDINPETISKLKQGQVHIYEPQLEELLESNIKEGRLYFTTELKEVINEADCIFICVGTPTNQDGSCNVEYVYGVAKEIGESIGRDSIVVVKSTVPVGTTSVVRSIIEEEVKKRGFLYDIECVSNPEFLKEGSAVEDFKKPDRILIGTDSLKVQSFFEELYAPFSRSKNKLIFMRTRSAEMSKYTANAMLATKISFINEMAQLCEKNGADISEVRAGIGSDNRIGYHFIYPGLGYGGSCFPKDVKALIHQGKECNLNMDILQSVEKVNNKQKAFLFDTVKRKLHALGGLHNTVIALWGIAFKPNTDDIREAPAIYTIERLVEEGARVRVYDPIAMENARRHCKDMEGVYFAQDMYDALEGSHILCIATEWTLFHQPDFTKIKRMLLNPCIIDGRNIYSKELLKSKGIDYTCVGLSDKEE